MALFPVRTLLCHFFPATSSLLALLCHALLWKVLRLSLAATGSQLMLNTDYFSSHFPKAATP